MYTIQPNDDTLVIECTSIIHPSCTFIPFPIFIQRFHLQLGLMA